MKRSKLRHSIRSVSATMTFGLLMACTSASQAASYTMYRDANCGCCKEWAAHAENGLQADMEVRDVEDMGAVKSEYGVPSDLRSCHTAIVEGYVIEGHVPAADVKRLLDERPAGVTGIGVAGMPIGSPGMEQSNHRQAFQVIAFGPNGRAVFASHPASP